MCGIAAAINHRDASRLVRASLGLIMHRGTEGFEMEGGPGFSLGANRLPIVERLVARQPARSRNGRLLCVLNGEIYNHLALREGLEAQGHRFATGGEAEVLLHLYQEHRERMLGLLDSEMFAFLIYDRSDGSFFAARDPLGVKPLYYAQEDGAIHFASELKQLTAICPDSAIHQVLPGHHLKDGVLTRWCALSPHHPPLAGSPDRIASRLRAQLEEAVAKRVQTDLPIAVFLSGGLDSTSVLALARRHHPDVTAIIAGREDSLDRHYALRYCSENGVPHRLVPLSEHMGRDGLQDIVRMVESYEPNVVRNSALSYRISEAARDFRVVLCGEGADELFYGYGEFISCPPRERDHLGDRLLSDLHMTQCQRVDRTSMRFTQEVRVPFLDKAMVDLARRIPADLKVRDGTVKWILRKAMEGILPPYILHRPKSALSEGAGFMGNGPGQGPFHDCAERIVSDEDLEAVRKGSPLWSIRDKEEALYFESFKRAGYFRIGSARRRPEANRSRESADIRVLLRSRRFSRHAPYRLEDVSGRPLRLSLLWGYLGKGSPDSREAEALDIISRLRHRLESGMQAAVPVKVLLADSHARINGLDGPGAEGYFQSMRRLLAGYGFEVRFLSGLWELWGLEDENIRSAISSVRIEDARLERSLMRASRRHFRGGGVEGHLLYCAMRKAERGFLEREFEGSIHLTYNGPEFRELLPDMPTLHIRSSRRSSAPPWLP